MAPGSRSNLSQSMANAIHALSGHSDNPAIVAEGEDLFLRSMARAESTSSSHPDFLRAERLAIDWIAAIAPPLCAVIPAHIGRVSESVRGMEPRDEDTVAAEVIAFVRERHFRTAHPAN